MQYFICSICGKNKELTTDNFYWRNDTNKWRAECIQCVALKKKKYYQKNSDKIKQTAASYREENKNEINKKAKIYNSLSSTKSRNKQYRVEHKKEIREKEKIWRLNNPEKHKEIARKKSKKQSQKPKNKIKAHVSRQINFALNRRGTSKLGNSVLKFLPYSINELKQHLEKQFESWMNWNNYGKYSSKIWKDDDKSTWTWQVDHIIPQSELQYISMNDDNFRKCWSLDNLRPLSAKQNSLDGSFRVRHKKDVK